MIHDSAYTDLRAAVTPLEARLIELIEEQKRAEDERASRGLLRTIQRAFREALLALPAEEYDWFDIQARSQRPGPGAPDTDTASDVTGSPADTALGVAEPPLNAQQQRQFFEFAGPLFSVAISPASSIVRVSAGRELRALPRDRSRRRVEENLEFHWRIADGAGAIENPHDQAVRFVASADPGLTRVTVNVRQRDVSCDAEALVTVTEELLPQIGNALVETQGLPGYTFERAAGESWRSRFDAARNVIVVNNGHRDFVYAARKPGLKLRYLVRLYAKELVLRNFVGLPADQLLERMVELSLRTEEHL